MFSQQLQEYAEERYEKRRTLLGSVAEVIEEKLAECTEEEQLLMRFFYGTMPLCDAGQYSFEVFLGFVRHALMLRETMQWCSVVPEDIFLHHILYYRINSENIEDCRRFFYDHLHDRIKGKTVEDAVLEINYWCAQNGTYEASDNRTISPMTLYRSGKGRCGEESTFAVTAFRSVGIPARQVYTPRWAHCDDNHAWVEVYVDGTWHFLGACEPEEVLDKGWFTNASSRALLVHARNFSDYSNGSEEACIGKEDMISFYNVTASYAKTKEFCVKVLEKDGTPSEHALVKIEVLNSGEYSSIAQLYTDEKGYASIEIGLGTVHLWIQKGSCGWEELVNTEVTDEVNVRLLDETELYMDCTGECAKKEGCWRDFDLKAPEDAPMHPVRLTKEMKDIGRRKLREAGNLRRERIQGYYQEEAAKKYPEEQERLLLAAGNFEEIYRFLDADANPDRARLLHQLSRKDLKDAKAEILESHIRGAALYREKWESVGRTDIYIKYILSPRILFEEMTNYRDVIREYLSEEAKMRFSENPEEIRAYVQEHINYDPSVDYRTIVSTPESALKLQYANPESQKILFVAICRTLGIPARVNRVTGEAQYYAADGFVSAVWGEEGSSVQPEMGTLLLKRAPEEVLNYYQNWTIARWKDGCYVTLDYAGMRFDEEEMHLALEAGRYRILTTTRLPGGGQLAAECRVQIRTGQITEVKMHLRSGKLEELLVSNQLDDFEVISEGVTREASGLLKGNANILAFFEEGQEPTEHVLNEMLEKQRELGSLEAKIWFLLKDETALEHATLQKVLHAVPSAKVLYASFDDVTEPLARRMYVDPEKLPLLIVTKPGMNGIYASSGYNVGSVDLMLKLLKLAENAG